MTNDPVGNGEEKQTGFRAFFRRIFSGDGPSVVYKEIIKTKDCSEIETKLALARAENVRLLQEREILMDVINSIKQYDERLGREYEGSLKALQDVRHHLRRLDRFHITERRDT